MRIITYILIIGLLASCRLQSSLQESSKQTSVSSDSTYFSSVVKIDTVTIPADTLRVEIPIEVFKRDTVIEYRNGRASTRIIYRDGKFDIKTQCDSLSELVLSYKERLFQSITEKDELIKSKEEVIVKPVRWYYKASLWFSLASGIYIFGSLFFKRFEIVRK